MVAETVERLSAVAQQKRATTLQKVSPGYTHKHGAELGKYKLQVTKHKVGYDASIKQ